MQQYKGKRILKNGAIGAYVLQSNGKYLWRIIGHTKSKKNNQVVREVHSLLLYKQVGEVVPSLQISWKEVKNQKKQKGG